MCKFRSTRSVRGIAWMTLLLVVLMTASMSLADDMADASMTAAEHRESVLKWRQGRIDRLLGDKGYLTLAGLFWLEEGEFVLGSDDSADFIVRAGATAARACVIRHHDGVTTVEPLPGTTVRVGGKRIESAHTLASDAGDPDLVEVEEITFYLIERGDRFGIRLRDVESPVRKSFHGIDSWEIDQKFAVVARFEAYDPPRQIPIANEIGIVEKMWSPGSLHFELDGQPCSMDALQNSLEEEELFLIFRDATSGTESYGSGRFLYTETPKNGTVLIDFNRAYNPPCAFSPYTTCPIPPLQNELDVAIRAGEKAYASEK